MIDISEEGARNARPVWLTTLADLGLLLMGFFVFLQATQAEPRLLASGFRAAFDAPAAEPRPAMPVAAAILEGFPPGSAVLPPAAHVVAWAREAARDPRTRITVTGEAGRDAADRDLATGSAAILAADRARAVAALLVRGGAVAPDRIEIATADGRRRAVLTLGYAGVPQ